jgi:predicted amidohydrolase
MTEAEGKTRRIAVGQIHCVPGDVAANLLRIERIVRAAAEDGAELVVMPETATTGYFMGDRLQALAEPAGGATSRRLGALAADCAVHLAVGMAILDGGSIYDAQLLFGTDARLLAIYRKAHLFAAERKWYAAGNTPTVVETEIGRIGMTICYDLIFPEYIRRLVDMGADVIINSTNWIADAWQRETWGWSGPVVQSLAATRALENGVWLAMADCVGPEEDFDSLGHSCIAAPSGRVVASLAHGQGFVAADAVRSSPDLERWRGIATYLQDRRPELYT